MSPSDALLQLKDAFPYGVSAVTDGSEGRTLQLVDLQGKVVEGVATILGWAYPNKDIYLAIKSVEERDDGWVVKTPEGRYLLKPLSKNESDKILSEMERV
jgi:hypothetical protein